jgi:hypothetical protein
MRVVPLHSPTQPNSAQASSCSQFEKGTFRPSPCLPLGLVTSRAKASPPGEYFPNSVGTQTVGICPVLARNDEACAPCHKKAIDAKTAIRSKAGLEAVDHRAGVAHFPTKADKQGLSVAERCGCPAGQRHAEVSLDAGMRSRPLFQFKAGTLFEGNGRSEVCAQGSKSLTTAQSSI